MSKIDIKRLFEVSLEVPMMRVEQLESLLSIWLQGEADEDTLNMISVALLCTSEIKNALNNAVEDQR